MARKSRSREVAEKINEHLRRFERDPQINIRRKYDRETRAWVVVEPKDPSGLGLYFNAGAYPTGNGRVGVVYICYQGASTLPLAEAEVYLAWLDAGEIGRHYDQQRAAKTAQGTG